LRRPVVGTTLHGELLGMSPQEIKELAEEGVI
jgi:hypothetical protein